MCERKCLTMITFQQTSTATNPTNDDSSGGGGNTKNSGR